MKRNNFEEQLNERRNGTVTYSSLSLSSLWDERRRKTWCFFAYFQDQRKICEEKRTNEKEKERERERRREKERGREREKVNEMAAKRNNEKRETVDF